MIRTPPAPPGHHQDTTRTPPGHIQDTSRTPPGKLPPRPTQCFFFFSWAYRYICTSIIDVHIFPCPFWLQAMTAKWLMLARALHAIAVGRTKGGSAFALPARPHCARGTVITSKSTQKAKRRGSSSPSFTVWAIPMGKADTVPHRGIIRACGSSPISSKVSGKNFEERRS